MEDRGPTERDAFFDRFYEKEFPKMWKYALAILADPTIAEEVVQDAFVEVLLNLVYLMTCEKPERWLQQTVKNKARHILRERARDMRRLVYLDAQGADSIPGADELEKVEEVSENASELKRKITEELSWEDLRLLVRYLRKNTTYKELSKESGLSIAACQKRIQRIRKKLEKFL